MIKLNLQQFASGSTGKGRRGRSRNGGTLTAAGRRFASRMSGGRTTRRTSSGYRVSRDNSTPW